ncbi:MAG: hypothetical protein WAO61_02860 [Solirubrobacterales bacterium]
MDSRERSSKMPFDAADQPRLEEFQALRKEIDRRSDAQDKLLALLVTAATAIIGLLVKNDGLDDRFGLALATMAGVFGVLWVDHARNIAMIGQYVRDKLWVWAPSWELDKGQIEKSGFERFIFAIAVSLTFVGLGVAGLVISYSDLPGTWWALAWISVALLNATMAGMWVAQSVYWLSDPSKR